MQSTGVCKICVGLTGDCNFFTFLQKPPLWTTEPIQLTDASSVQPVYVISSVFICQCTDVYNFRSVGLTGDSKMPQSLSLGPKSFQGAVLRPARGGFPRPPSANRVAEPP